MLRGEGVFNRSAYTKHAAFGPFHPLSDSAMTDRFAHSQTSAVTLLRQPAQAPDCNPSGAVEAYLRKAQAQARERGWRRKDGMAFATDTLSTDIALAKEQGATGRWVYDEEKQAPVLRSIVSVDHRDLLSIRRGLASLRHSGPDQVIFVVRTAEEEKLAWCREWRDTIIEWGDEAVIVND